MPKSSRVGNKTKSCARHIFREKKMKKIIAFAITALLVGGFAFNANAQVGKATPKPKAQAEKVQKAENYDQMLKDYESYINKYIENYEKALKASETNAKSPDWATPLKKAQDLQARLEKAKESLSKAQMEKFLKLKDKLANALKRKG